MTVNVEVNRNPEENSLNLIRRFTKRVRGSGLLPKARTLRYATRSLSYYKKKKKALKTILKTKEIERLKKLGKIAE